MKTCFHHYSMAYKILYFIFSNHLFIEIGKVGKVYYEKKNESMNPCKCNTYKNIF